MFWSVLVIAAFAVLTAARIVWEKRAGLAGQRVSRADDDEAWNAIR